MGGPVGSGKTTLVEKLCKAMRGHWSVAVITNDIYTREDALILARLQALPEDRIMGVEDRRLPAHRHPRGRLDQPGRRARAQREISRSRRPVHRVRRRQPGGPPSRRTWPTMTLYVISVCQGEKIPRKGGPAHHPLGPADHQQDRPRSPRRRGPGRSWPATRAAKRGARPVVFSDLLRLKGRGRDRAVHHRPGRAARRPPASGGRAEGRLRAPPAPVTASAHRGGGG
ncbi:MAG: GTP-binding protein [Caulobacteraceae bacterium]